MVRDNNIIQVEIKKELAEEYRRVKLHLSNILHCRTTFCVICLQHDKVLNSLDDWVNINHWEGDYCTTVNDMLEYLFPKELSNLIFGCSICEDCREKVAHAFLFIRNTKRTAELIQEYLHQLNDGIDEIEESIDFSDTAQYALLVLQDPVDDEEVGIKNEEADNINEVLEERIELADVETHHDFENEQETIVKESIQSQSEGQFMCEHCSKIFKTKNGIQYHMQIHNTKLGSIFTCPQCESESCRHDKYLDAYKLQKLAGSKKFTCPDCNYVCWTKKVLIAHANKIHLKAFDYVCEYCGKPLYSQQSYTTHILCFHTKLLSCKYCGRSIKNEENLLRHQIKCKRIPKPYKCSECKLSFSTEGRLNKHQITHDSKYQLPCNLCNKVFTNKYILKRHQYEAHSVNGVRMGQRNYYCSICHRKFSTMKEKKHHMRNHGPNDKHKCLICNTEHDTAGQYENHIRSTKHLHKINPQHRLKHKCKECDYSTVAQDILEGHINAYHLKIAPYECGKCQKRFTSTRSLGNHLKLHITTSSHTCHICGNNFRGHNSLKIHLRRRHTGERPYDCDLCDESFVNISSRSLHKLRKHCEKTVKCPLCDLLFHSLANMRSHFRKMHWKRSGEEFDITKVEGVKKEDYELFRDRRLIVLN